MPTTPPLTYRVETTLHDGTVELSLPFQFRSTARLYQDGMRERPEVRATALVPSAEVEPHRPRSILQLIAGQSGLDPAFRAGIVVAANASGA